LDFNPLQVKPKTELARVEPHELADFEERDSPLGDQASDMPRRHSQQVGNGVDV
jgi:hypothetical protein